ncbi:MAG: polysaccharide deacetylase family protein [Oscillospiraceae bacterium]|nr:polysaccharide deacetylase family protein [Oscillospiraceae bacterium]
MKSKQILLTVFLVLLTAVCLLWAGLTIYGFDVIGEIGSFIKGAPDAVNVSFDSREITLGVGQKLDIGVNLNPKEAENEYTISCTDKNILYVKGNTIKALAEGSCTIKVTTDNKLTDYCDVVVNPAPKKLSLPDTLVLADSESYSFKPKTDVDLSANTLTYENSNDDVAVIDEKGNLTPKNTGATTVTVTSYNGLSAKCVITVKETPLSFTLSGGAVQINQGKSILLNCEFQNGDGTSSMKFASSDEKIATVTKNGLVTGVREGTATITCTLFNNVTATCEIIVVDRLTGIRTNLDTKKPMVALTFDDGPAGKNTLSILKTLKKYKGRATFFVVGTRVAENSEVLKAAYDAGNEIGNHSWDHSYAEKMSVNKQIEEVTKTNNAVRNIIGVNPTLFRCPGGISGKGYTKYGNLPIITWSIDTLDWSTKNTKSTYKSITKVFKKNENLDGDIVLMHDIQNSTPKAVEQICKYLHKKNYQFVTVSELAYYRGVEMENGQTYNCFYY